MKKTTLILFLAAFVLAFGTIAAAQDQIPPRALTAPPAPIVVAVPAVAAAPDAEARPVERTAPVVEAVAPTPTAPVAVAVELAHQTVPTTAPKPTPALRTELIKLKYADIETVTNLLRAYQSSVGRVSPAGRAENAIVITDVPEIVEKMLAIVRDIDLKPVEIQFTIQLVQGSENDEKGDEALKNDPVIRELRGVLKYKSFSLLDGTIMRVVDSESAEAKIGPKGEYTVSLRPKYAKDGTVETIQTAIRLGKMVWTTPQTANTDKKGETGSTQTQPVSSFSELIRTTLLLKAGEKTVVGVSKSDADQGLILILSAKVVK
ncbi:MAG: hypothetical protein ACYDH3_07000 [Candidatus Aminicenantales bacterium]